VAAVLELAFEQQQISAVRALLRTAFHSSAKIRHIEICWIMGKIRRARHVSNATLRVQT
jgi:hypothetical protein